MHMHICMCVELPKLFAEQPVPGEQYRTCLHIQVPGVIGYCFLVSQLFYSLLQFELFCGTNIDIICWFVAGTTQII